MRLGSAITVFILIAVVVVGAFARSSDVIKEKSTPTIIHGGDARTKQVQASFSIDEQLNAFTQYTFCFRYNTTGLALPSFLIRDSVDGAHPIQVDFPRNSWGLGDVCFRIMTHYHYTDPVLTFIDAGSNTLTIIYKWTVSPSRATLTRFSDRSILKNDTADVYLQNNYLSQSFVLPIAAFLILWLGSGFTISSCIFGLSRGEIIFLAPITGMTFIAFVAYLLSLLGIYNLGMFVSSITLVSVYAFFRRRISVQLMSAPGAGAADDAHLSQLSRLFDTIAILLIVYMMYKYLFVASTPFFATWDGLVSWNKWGADWAAREMRGNYQFTYPQMIPLFYSVYYKLAGYSAKDPLGLSMNSAHFFITYIGLLALPLLYLCSKALKIHPIIPVCLVLLSEKFFSGMNNGYVDNALVTYSLACVLVMLRASPAKEAVVVLPALAICLVGAGAIFLKQTGIFASLAVFIFLLVYYKKTMLSRLGLCGAMLILFVPVEFYLHEIILDLYPALVEDNPRNHSIGGVLSNAGTQLQLVDTTLAWYVNLAGKLMAPLMQLPKSSLVAVPLAIVVTLIVIGGFAKVFVSLYRLKKWGVLLAWCFIVGGHLLIAAKFGGTDETRYTLALIPIFALLSGILVHKLTAVKLQILYPYAVVGSGLLVAYTAIKLASFTPLIPPPAPANGFDTISFEERLRRFFHPAHVKVSEYLVSQKDQNFRLFTESDFVVWPYTIYDSSTKSTPTKMSQIYRSGDYWYSMWARKCPDGFERVPIDVGTFVFCRKK